MRAEIVDEFLRDPVNGRLALSASLESFVRFFHWYIYHDDFVVLGFHREIIRRLEDIAFGRAKKRNLVVNIPPRFGKSSLMKYACAWSYMLNPSSNCIYTSYSDSLVNSFSKDIRDIIESPAFRELTGIRLSKSRTGADYWATEQGGGFRAAALGGSLTGYGAGISGDGFGGFCLIDDPLKASNVKSRAEIQNSIDYYVNTLKSRANNQKRTPFVLIMQRLDIEDLTGYILENEADDWEVVKLPALNEETGKALWEERYPAEMLLKLKEQAPFVYYGQYQQEPIVIGGSVYKAEWFRYYNTNILYDYRFSFFTADTAQKKGEANDFTVLQYWAKTVDNKLHLIDQVRGKYDAEELEEEIVRFWDRWKLGINGCTPIGFYIEDKSSGIGVLQSIRKKYPIPVRPISRARYKDDNGMWKSQDKFTRAMTAIPYIANGWVYLPNSEKDDISASILSEAVAFKADLSHKHDDQIDPMNDAIDIAFGATGLSSIFIVGDE